MGVKMNRKSIIVVGSLMAIIVLGVVGVFGYSYASTPANIRTPEFEHYHLRTQVVIDGESVDFSKNEFQREYDGNTCSAEISEEPFDFHDGVDQFVHVHWDSMTGGQLLKYYGLNVLGGVDNSLGNNYTNGILSPSSVGIYGDFIPDPSEASSYYVYVGDENSYQQKSWDDFINQDLEEFFGQKSNLSRDEQASLIEKVFFPKAYAHGEVEDEHSESSEKSEEELKRINNLIGNVVIFAQEIEPTSEQVTERFSNLVPLHDSTCGG